MDMVIVFEGFRIVSISMILEAMIDVKESEESSLSNILVGVLRCICHVSSLGLSRMT